MLQIREIQKEYVTGTLHQTALEHVSLNLRDNEFVAVLGPSGSGKTTLLNIIGGLDRYDDGDLIINGISTKKYKDRDWDSYRNHTIGFVFQSYNLIPHQSVLANVELALTISGISRSERRRRAREALEKVGLGDQVHKRPNQMSGGQMQRVAIARALVNDPDILLADEPTGALDTDTSVQVMDLLKEVAKDRLVVMVTHNPELAEQYATRVVRLRDGKIIDDSDPFEVDEEKLEKPKHKNMGKASMSFFTALLLSFNNLRTKKARTFLTSFAGSIGIIGIALILSLSTGASNYIDDIQKDTMTSYPISIQAQTIDLSNIMQTGRDKTVDAEPDHKLDAVYSNGTDFEMASTMTTSITKNNLTAFKKYLDNPKSEIHDYIGENGVIYSYQTKFGVYTHDPDGVFVNTDGSTLAEKKTSSNQMLAGMSAMKDMMDTGNTLFTELMPGTKGKVVSDTVGDNYDVLYGHFPKKYDEVVLMVNRHNELSSVALYQLGVLPTAEYRELYAKVEAGEQLTLDKKSWSYEEICEKELRLIPDCETYRKGENGNFTCVADDTAEMEKLMKNAMKLKIVGIVRPTGDSKNENRIAVIGYSRLLTERIMQMTDDSPVVKAQLTSKEKNVLNGLSFAPSDDKAKIADAKIYLSNLGVTEKAAMCKQLMQAAYAGQPEAAAQFAAMSETQLAGMLDEYLKHPEDQALLSIYNTYISSGTYDENLTTFGVVSTDAPSAINIYVDSFEAKDGVSDCIERYNAKANEEDKISFTDYVGLLMSSITTIIDVISYVLIAFVAVSLVVSSIMIGIITYISVLERTKEIGILRAIGASKRNISQVFNAETFIIGLFAGLIGIGISLLVLLPGNAVIHSLANSTEINATLPVGGAVVLVLLSIVLTLLGGLIPSKKAAKKDPVTALRSE